MNVLTSVQEKLHLKEFKYLTTIAVIFVSVLLISNVASTKITAFWGFEFDAGTILFPLSYIFGDILTEVYGYKRSRRIIWMGMIMAILMAGLFSLVAYLPASENWAFQDSYMNILGQTPRIVLASVIAYFAGEFSNSYILAKIKIWMKGRKLWVRTILSTLVGEGIDTVLFVLIAFYGVDFGCGADCNSVLATIIFSNYVFKVGVEILFTPFTYLIVRFLKKNEGVDVYDTDTNFNPFKLEV